MKQAFDQSTVALTLRDGINKGYWTLENLDQPSAGWQANERAGRLHPLNIKSKHRLHRNRLRDQEDTDMY